MWQGRRSKRMCFMRNTTIPKSRVGGSRPGAGRPAEGNDRPSKIQLDPRDLKLLDANRGTESRSAVVRRLIQQEFEPGGTTQK